MRLVATDLVVQHPPAPPLISSLSLTVDPGGITALTGPSGSGKSSLLEVLGELVPPVGGTVRREGVETLAWVFQHPEGVAGRTAIDHVALPILAKGSRRRPAEKAALDIMERFGLAHLARSTFSKLSGGEGQRLMLARAVAFSPDLLLIDEPTAQLDRPSARSVAEVLMGLASRDRLIVIATHDQELAARAQSVVDLETL